MLENLINIVTSIVSVVCAIWSFLSASRAAQIKEQIRNKISNQKKLNEASNIHDKTRKILSVISKVGGPACTESHLKGIDCASIAKDVQEYCSYINEHSAGFTKSSKNIVKELCKELYTDIEALAEAKTYRDKKSAGKKIYIKINDGFLPVAKEHADEIREYIVLQ